jgi:hypothetical protein
LLFFSNGKKRQILEWMRYAAAHQQSPYEGGRNGYKEKNYLFPGLYRVKVCMYAIAFVLGMKRPTWQTIAQHVTKNCPLEYALQGRMSNRKNPSLILKLQIFFQDLEKLGAPHGATCLVTRVLTGGGENGSAEEACVTWELRNEDQEVG